MVGPIDYTMQVLDPIQGYLQGLQFGENIQTARLGREQTRQSMGIQAAQEARAAEAFRMQKAEAARKLAEARRSQQALLDLFNNPNPTSADFERAYLANPAFRDEIKFMMDRQSSAQKDAQLRAAQSLYAASAQGNIPVVRRLLEESRDAFAGSGNEQMVSLVDEALKMADKDPESAIKSLRTGTGFLVHEAGGDIDKLNDALGIGGGMEWRHATPAESSAYGAKFGQVNVKTGEFKAAKEPLVQNIIGDTEGTLAKELAKNDATRISATIDAGVAASRNLAQLDTLSSLMGEVKTGGGAVLKSWLGETLGIATEGLDEIQGFQAAISRLIPAQRTEGSGSSSDLDVKMFKDGLPGLMKQPRGNEIIVATLREINEYDVAASLIAGKVSDWAMTPESERKDLQARGLILSPSQGRQAILDLGSATPTYKEYLKGKQKDAPEVSDAKAAFMADPRVQALSEAQREAAWEIYQQQVSK